MNNTLIIKYTYIYIYIYILIVYIYIYIYNKTIYYIKIRKRHATYMPTGAFICLKNSVCVFSAPAGAFIFPKNGVFVFSAPAGAFIFLKKCIFVLSMSARGGLGWQGGGRGSRRGWGRVRGGRGQPSMPTFFIQVRTES